MSDSERLSHRSGEKGDVSSRLTLHRPRHVTRSLSGIRGHASLMDLAELMRNLLWESSPLKLIGGAMSS